MYQPHLILIFFAGLLLQATAFALARSSRLSLKYATLWIVLGLMVLSFPILFVSIDDLGSRLRIQAAYLILGIPLLIVGLLVLILTIQMSQVFDKIRILAEAIALIADKTKERASVEEIIDDPDH